MERGTRLRHPRVPWFVTFLAFRLVWALITLFIFLTAVFFFMQVWVPYSWGTQFMGGGRATYEAALAQAGLDRPLSERYAEFMLGLTRGDLGESYGGAPVAEIISAALPVTLTVFVAGTLVGWIVGEFLGRWSAWRRQRRTGSAISILGVVSATIFPPFLVFLLVRWLREPLLDARRAMGLPTDSLDVWRGAITGEEGAVTPDDVRWLIALGLMAAFAMGLVVRAYGRRRGLFLVEAIAVPAMLVAAGVGIWISGVGVQALDLLYRHDIQAATGRGSPALALLGIAMISFGQVMFLMRVGIEAERSEDYVLTARSKGLADRVVRDRHVVRNAIAPVLAGSFLTFPTVLAGMVIVEYELGGFVGTDPGSGRINIQGLSSVLFSAIEFQDIPVIMGVIVVLGIIGVGFRLLTDLTIAVLDPRLRQGSV